MPWAVDVQGLALGSIRALPLVERRALGLWTRPLLGLPLFPMQFGKSKQKAPVIWA